MRGDKISAVVMDPKQQPTVPQTMAKRIHSAALGEWSQKPRPRKGPSDAIDPRVSLSIKRKLRGKCIHGQDWVNNANHIYVYYIYLNIHTAVSYRYTTAYIDGHGTKYSNCH